MESDHIRRMKQAAEANNGEAQYDLGMAYLNGDGIEQSYAEAYFWLTVCYDTRGVFLTPEPSKLAADASIHLLHGDTLDRLLDRVTPWHAEHGQPHARDY